MVFRNRNGMADHNVDVCAQYIYQDPVVKKTGWCDAIHKYKNKKKLNKTRLKKLKIS